VELRHSTQFVCSDGTANRTRIADYTKDVERLELLLEVLAYLTGGPPPRGTELESAQWNNSVMGGLRNMFVMRRRLAIVLRYHKGFNKRKMPKIISRFLPEEVGNQFIWYRWLVHPFVQVLEGMTATGPEDARVKRVLSPFMWPNPQGGRSTSSHRLREVLREASIQHLGQGIITSLWRHIIIAIGRKLMNLDIDDYFDATDFGAAIDEAESNAFDQQAGHSPEIASNVYAKLIGDVFHGQGSSSATAEDSFFRNSIRWHVFQGWPSAVAKWRSISLVAHKRKRSSLSTPDPLVGMWEEGVEEASGLPTAALLRAKAHLRINEFQALRQMYGPDAVFHGRQLEALQAILEGESLVVYVDRTGGGKSLLFMLPAAQPNYGLTIVFLPLVTLRIDLLRRCAELKIPCQVWTRATQDSQRGLLLTTSETLDGSAELQSYIRRNAAQGLIARLVIDECHYPLVTTSRFRPVFKRLGRITSFEIPMTLMTATLPPESEAELFRQMCINTSGMTLIRCPTVRTNIGYKVAKHDDKSEGRLSDMDTLAGDIKTRHAFWGRRRTLVYLARKSHVQILAAILCCFSMDSTTTDKRGVLQQFRAANDAILLATSSLREGTDIPNVTLVLHYGIPESLIRYIQESGRGGRSGEACEATIVLAESLPSHIGKQDHATQQRMNDYLQQDVYNKQCRRIVIDRYMDNDLGRERCLATEAQCDVCGSRQLVGASSTAIVLIASACEEANPPGAMDKDDELSDYGDNVVVDPELLDSPTPQRRLPFPATP
jgi:superfamily II DNA helicase RecQ